MHALEMLPVSRSVGTTRVRHAQALDRLAQDSFVSLMEYKMIDVFDRNARIDRKLMDRVADGVDAELEHAAAIHGQHARAICGSLKRRGAEQTGNAQGLDVGRRRKLNGKGVVSPSPNHCGSCPIAKEHARGTVGPIERARHLLGRND